MLKISGAVKALLQKYELNYNSCFVRCSFGTLVKYELFQFDIEQLAMTHYILVFKKLQSKTSRLIPIFLC